MSLHRYPRSVLVQDDVRAAAGLAVTVGVLSVARLPAAVIYVFVALTALFAAFAVRTIARHFAVLEVSEAGVRTTGPAGGSIDWEELQDLRLRYYSPRRDRENGWMHLKIKGRHATIRIDSRRACGKLKTCSSVPPSTTAEYWPPRSGGRVSFKSCFSELPSSSNLSIESIVRAPSASSRDSE